MAKSRRNNATTQNGQDNGQERKRRKRKPKLRYDRFSVSQAEVDAWDNPDIVTEVPGSDAWDYVTVTDEDGNPIE